MRKAFIVMLLLCIFIAMSTVHITVIPGTGHETITTLDVCSTVMDLVLDSAPTIPETVYVISFIQPSDVLTETMPPGAAQIFTLFIDKPPEV